VTRAVQIIFAENHKVNALYLIYRLYRIMIETVFLRVYVSKKDKWDTLLLCNVLCKS